MAIFNLTELDEYITAKVNELLEIKLKTLNLSINNDYVDSWFTIDEAAEYLHLSKSTIYTYSNPNYSDPIPFEKAGKQNRYYKSELDGWLQRRSIKFETNSELDSRIMTDIYCPNVKKGKKDLKIK